MEIARLCPMCGKVNKIKVDDKLKEAVNRYENGIGYIQDIPLSASEREFIKTGFCMNCQAILFAPPCEEEWEDDSNIGCSDCPDDECTGHCMSCSYRPV